MVVDRYVKVVLTVIAVALVAIVVQLSVPGVTLRDAVRPGAALAQSSAPKYEVTVPKSWGKFIAYSNNNLLLQTPDGTMRIVDIEGKAPEYPKLKGVIHWD